MPRKGPKRYKPKKLSNQKTPKNPIQSKDSKENQLLLDDEILKAKLITSIADNLDYFCQANSKLPKPKPKTTSNLAQSEDNPLDVFKSEEIPSMSVEDYLSRFVKYAELTLTDIVEVYILIDRVVQHTLRKYYSEEEISQAKDNLYTFIDYTNVHRLMLIAVLLIFKKNSEYKNFIGEYYKEHTSFVNVIGDIGGLFGMKDEKSIKSGKEELTKLEPLFLKLIKFELYISPEEYIDVIKELLPNDHLDYVNLLAKYLDRMNSTYEETSYARLKSVRFKFALAETKLPAPPKKPLQAKTQTESTAPKLSS